MFIRDKKPKTGNDLFRELDKGASAGQDVLAKSYRSLWTPLKLTFGRFMDLVINYTNDPNNGVPADRRNTVRGNLMKALLRPTMSWKTFQRGLRVLEADRAEVYVVIHVGGRRFLVKEEVYLGPEVRSELNQSLEGNIAPGTDIESMIRKGKI